MKLLRYALVLGLLAAPAPLLAQQGGMQRGGMMMGATSPAEMVLTHRDALSLTGEQVTQLEGIQQKLEEKNAPLRTQVQAIRGSAPGQAGRTPNGNPQQRQEMQRRMEQARPLMQQMQQNNQQAVQEIQAVLTPEQQVQMQEIMRKQREEMMRQRQGGERMPQRPGRS